MEHCFELTHPQRRVMSVEAFHAGTSMFNIGGFVRVQGLLDPGLLAEAIREFVERHQQLRMRLVRREAALVQEICATTEPVAIAQHDLTDAGVERLLAERFREPFRLIDAPLHHFAVHQSRTSTYFEIKMHHVAADGWSVNILIDQVRRAYMRLKRGEGKPLPAAPAYLELLEYERAYLASEGRIADERFWAERVAAREPSGLRSSPDTSAERVEYELGPDRSAQLKAFCRARKLKPGPVFCALFGVLLARRHRLESVVLGLPRLNRHNRRQLATFGMFTNIIPVAVPAARGDFASLFEAVSTETQVCATHQQLPYDLIAQHARKGATGPRELYDFSFNYYAGSHGTSFDGFPAESVERFSGHQAFRLSLGIKEWNEQGAFTAFIDYRTGDYDAADIEDLWGDLVRLLDAAMANPGREIAAELDARVVASQAIHKGVSAEFPYRATVTELFKQQVAEGPLRVAVRHGDAALSFRELDARAEALGRRLRELGIRPGDPVGVIGDHSFELIVAFVALAMLDAVCVPMDHKAPAERLHLIVSASGMRHVLRTTEGSMAFPGLTVVDLRPEPPENCTSPAPARAAPVDGDHPLYMIFTSGSTGVPKGVLVSNRSLLNYVWWGRRYYLDNRGDSFALYSSIAFDLTLTSIYLPLLTGQEIVIYEARGGELALDRILREDRCTIVKATPSHLALVAERTYASQRLRLFIVGGERFEHRLAARVHAAFGERVAQVNEYGPTEATIGCMYHEFDPATDEAAGSVPIGRPIDNATIMLLDEALAPVPKGEKGEIYIGGEGVALGYFGRPELTAQRFLADPYAPGGRMYKTGDLAFVNRREQLEYVGRVDRQCKFLGFRIEPEEIEAAITALPGIQQAHVIVETAEDGRSALMAYVAARKGAFSERHARQILRQRLPHYMMPTHFVALESLPLTLNGKVDVNRLPRLATLPKNSPEGLPADVADAVVEALRAVLGVDEIRDDLDFFALGGDSVKAIQIATYLEGKGVTLAVRDILSFPEVGRMKQFAASRGETEPEEQGQPLPSLPATPILCWLREQRLPVLGAYAQAAILDIETSQEPDELAALIDDYIAAVPIFRGALALGEGRVTPLAVITPGAAIERFDAIGAPEEATLGRLETLALVQCRKLDPTSGDLVRASLARVAEDRYLLMLVIHHIAVDVVSWHNLAADLGDAVTRGTVDAAAARRHYRMHALWAAGLSEHAQRLAPEARFWAEMAAPGGSAPAAANGLPPRLGACVRRERVLSATTTEQLLTSANRAFNTRPLELLVAALARAAERALGAHALVLELEGHGRDAVVPGCDVSRCIGWFTALYPVAVSVTGRMDEDIKSAKDRVRTAAARAPEFGMFKYISGAPLPSGRRLRLNFIGEIGADLATGPVRLRSAVDLDAAAPENPLTCLLDIVMSIRGRRLHLAVKGAEDELGEGFVERFAEDLERAVAAVVAFCASRDTQELTRSDFDAADVSEDDLENLIA